MTVTDMKVNQVGFFLEHIFGISTFLMTLQPWLCPPQAIYNRLGIFVSVHRFPLSQSYFRGHHHKLTSSFTSDSSSCFSQVYRKHITTSNFVKSCQLSSMFWMFIDCLVDYADPLPCLTLIILVCLSWSLERIMAESLEDVCIHIIFIVSCIFKEDQNAAYE